jgi:rhodanese-related sulfurtransferase
MNRIILAFGIGILGILISCQNQGSTAIPQVETNSKLVNLSEAKKMLAAGEVIALDVRTPEEISEGKIQGALEIDYKANNFKEKIEKLDKSASYLVYCRSGGRSAKCTKLMKKLGFKQTYDLDGGYAAWSSEK